MVSEESIIQSWKHLGQKTRFLRQSFASMQDFSAQPGFLALVLIEICDRILEKSQSHQPSLSHGTAISNSATALGLRDFLRFFA